MDKMFQSIAAAKSRESAFTNTLATADLPVLEDDDVGPRPLDVPVPLADAEAELENPAAVDTGTATKPSESVVVCKTVVVNEPLDTTIDSVQIALPALIPQSMFS